MKLLNQFVLCIIVFLCITLTSCSMGQYYQTEANVADVTQQSKDWRKRADCCGKKRPALVVKDGLYVDQTPISLMKDPQWLRNRIVIRGEDLPFAYYSRTIVSNANGQGYSHTVLTRYQVGLDPNTKLSLNYVGDIRGALDMIAAKTGYVYTINGNDVYWQAFVTKTFNIAFMPGVSDYMMGKAGGGSSSLASSGGGPGGGTTVSAIVDDSANNQFSSLKGTISVWDDLAKTVKQLLSPDGTVIVSQATTSVTVRDKPSNIELVSKYIENMNANLSKQVLVKIQVLEVTLSSDFSLGINWNVVQHAFGHSDYILNANYGTPISITGAVAKLGLQAQAGATTFFTSLINALRQQGKVSVVSEPRVVCLNNQVSAIRIVQQQGYLASVQNTSLAGAGGGTSSSSNLGTVTSQLTPGQLVTGITIYLLPKILDEKIYLQANVDLSNNLGFTTFGPNGANSSSASSTGQSNIQLPNVSQKQFNQRSVIRSGETLILSGFRQINNEADSQQLLESQTLGGRGSHQENTETVVLITPIILHGAC